MGVSFSSTQEEQLLGQLTNGLKLVYLTLTITDGGTSQTSISVNSLQRVLGWIIAFGIPATDTFVCSDNAVQLNTIDIIPSGNAMGDVLYILAIGF
jgi:hypothetical protein